MLGCRIFFCDPSFQPVMVNLYPRYAKQIEELHVRHALPYEYFEFEKAIRRRVVSSDPAGAGGCPGQPPPDNGVSQKA